MAATNSVDYPAVAVVLTHRHLAGATFEVWPDETITIYPTPVAMHHHSVIMTPPDSALTRQSRLRLLATIGENLRHWMASDAA